MKKLIAISILLVLLSVTAFAELTVNVDSNFWTDAVFFKAATGDMADADSVKGVTDIFAGSRMKNNELSMKFTWKGEGYDAGLVWSLNGLVRNGHENNTPGGAGPDYSRNEANIQNTATNAGFFNSSNTNFNVLLGQNFGDFWVKNTKGLFRGYLGNEAKRGAMGDYRWSYGGSWSSATLDNYGVVKFPWLSIGTTPSNGNSFSSMVGSQRPVDDLKVDNAHLDVGIALSELGLPDIRFEIASNLLFSGWPNNMSLNSNGVDAASNTPSTSASAIAGAFRLSGYKVADFISFDAIYRIQGNDPNTRLTFNNGIADPLGNNTATTGSLYGTTKGGLWSHDIGVYAGFNLLKMIDIGAGVTASFDDVEKTRVAGTGDRPADATSNTVEYVKPLFLGFDLRLQVKLSSDLKIALNNNLSLASQRGENGMIDETGGRYIQPMGYYLNSFGAVTGADRTNTPGIWSFQKLYGGMKDPEKSNNVVIEDSARFPGNMTNTDTSDSWFALWNTLMVEFKLNPKVTLAAQIANKLGVYDFIGIPEKEFSKYTTDNFAVGVGATYNLGAVKFGAGLNLDIWSMQADVTTTTRNPNQASPPKEAVGTYSPSLTSGKIGEVRFAIPIRFGVNW